MRIPVILMIRIYCNFIVMALKKKKFWNLFINSITNKKKKFFILLYWIFFRPVFLFFNTSVNILKLYSNKLSILSSHFIRIIFPVLIMMTSGTYTLGKGEFSVQTSPKNFRMLGFELNNINFDHSWPKE